MRQDQVLGNRQPQPCPCASGARRIGLVEPLEDSTQVLGLDADTRIRYPQLHLLVATSRPDLYPSGRWRELDGIAEQVCEHLAHASRVRAHPQLVCDSFALWERVGVRERHVELKIS